MSIHEILGDWFEANKRNLPWRSTSDPYKIWISEVILQQTRVNQGIEYYRKFIQVFPDIISLANSQIDIVLKIWQGLGYYTRARNIHETAKYIARVLKGIFPGSYNELINLKGIGSYTAAAIASIAFKEPVAAIDGNVRRVLGRLFYIRYDLNSGRGKLKITKYADSILDSLNPGRHNQALMELGAIICLPKNPKCIQCPLTSKCLAFRNNRMNDIPLYTRKKKSRDRFLIYMIITTEDSRLLLGRREGKDIWNQLYEFPMTETNAEFNEKDLREIFDRKFNLKIENTEIIKISPEVYHSLSHQRLISRFIHMRIRNPDLLDKNGYFWIKTHDFRQFPVPRLIDKYVETNGI